MLARARTRRRKLDFHAAVFDAPAVLPFPLLRLVAAALILIVGVAVFAFFVAVGLLMVNAEVRHEFMGSTGHVVLRFHLFGEPVGKDRVSPRQPVVRNKSAEQGDRQWPRRRPAVRNAA